jgi:hypothetical protein
VHVRRSFEMAAQTVRHSWYGSRHAASCCMPGRPWLLRLTLPSRGIPNTEYLF